MLRFVKILQKLFKFKIVGVSHGFNLKKFIKDADLLFCINSKQLKTVQEVVKNKSVLVPNYTYVNPDQDLMIKFNGKTVIGTLSRIDFEYKNLDQVVKAAKILKDRGRDFIFHIGGDFGEIESLKKMVLENNLEQNFVFKGLVTDKKQFFNEIDIFCMPSKNETFGISYIEAMAHQVPVVATENDGSNDIFVQKGSALLIAREDFKQLPEKIAENIEKLIDNKELGLQIANIAFKEVLAKYSLQKMKEDFEKIFV